MSIAQTGAGHHPSPTAALADHLWQRIQARLEVSFGRLETIVAYLFERPLSGEEVAEALRLSNHLASKLATLGAAAAADLIRSAATLMDREEIGSKDAINVAAVLDDARLAVASTVADTRITGDSGQHLLVVSPSMVQADEVMWVAISQGMKVTYHENGLRPLHDGERPPDIVLVVLPDPDLAQAKPLLRAVEQQFFGVPVVGMCPSNTLRQRLVGVGQITTIMLLESHPLEVMNELRLAVARLKQNRAVIAIGKSSDWLSAKLTEHGLVARVERSPGAAFRAIAAGEARAIVIVQDAASITALEMTALIRADIATREATVVVVADKKISTQALFEAGADAVFGGDVGLTDLVVAVKSRLHRSLTTRTRAESEMGQGALPWAPAVVLIERLLMGSMRRSAPVGFGLIKLPADRNSDRDEQIAREFRRGDVIARYDDQHLVAVLDGVSRHTLVSRLRALSEQFNLKAYGTRIGCLEFPIDGRSVEDLVTGGLRMLDRADAASGPMVVGADWRPDGERPADVLIVDPDMTLGSVLRATMERRGLNVEHQPDSLEALKYLTGATDRPLPRVVLLELEQHGVGGLQFLRQISASGNMGFMKVIVLSSRTVEADMRQAFEIGVADYVAKPFSTPLLLHRIQRVLDS